jgi:biotin carboxylase
MGGKNGESLKRMSSFYEARSMEERTLEHKLWDENPLSKLEKNRGRQLQRANSFASRQRSISSAASPRVESIMEGLALSDSKITAVAVVDPFSTGAHLANLFASNGIKVVRVLSIWDSPVAALIQEGIDVDFVATVQHDDSKSNQDEATNDTVRALQALPFSVAAVVPGAETGVELADRLSARMGLRSNGEEHSLARRNKYYMGESVRDAGVRAVEQKFCRTALELKIFLQGHAATLRSSGQPFKCVVKPVQSAGSDDVFLCDSIEEAETAFRSIFGKKNGLGLVNDGALVQEFLVGKEYVVDKVSRDGEHKLVAIWEYDKRPVNGANFVYFGMRLMECVSARSQELVAYADGVLNALGIREGPSHMEVMFTPTGPCLVEVGSRCHGGEGTWLPVAKECIGYTQVDVTADVYLEGKLFTSLDARKYPKKKAGMDVDMVNFHSGVLRKIKQEHLLRAMPSFRTLNWECKVGDFLPATHDCFTRPGSVQLVNDTEEGALKDQAYIHKLFEHSMFDYTIMCPEHPSMGAVVVVDPFSTGAMLAANVVKMGYKLILVFSEVDSPVAGLVSQDAAVDSAPSSIIYHNGAASKEKALQETMAAIKKGTTEQKSPLLAILAGAETGVELADALSHAMGCRSNGEDPKLVRRDKCRMQEQIASDGIRSVKQVLAFDSATVQRFVDTLDNPKCVVKPNMSAGSDSVYLCRNKAEAVEAFTRINAEINGLGQVNEGALCQEFLEGLEFVVDGCSRDGEYKVTAVWEYDKRSVNDANFVYFGMRMRDARLPHFNELIAYAEKVVGSLGIVHGPSHMELMMTSTGPCLIEVGSRCHGGEGTWVRVAEDCVGYTQVEATLDCYLRPDRFDALPPVPALKAFGAECFLVSFQAGRLVDMPGMDRLRNLASFRRLEMLVQLGMPLKATVDCFTRPGSVQLVAPSVHALEADYDAVRALEKSGLFKVA